MNLFLVPRFVQLSVMATYHDLLVGYSSLFNKKASVMVMSKGQMSNHPPQEHFGLGSDPSIDFTGVN